jgi:hypothetical protein
MEAASQTGAGVQVYQCLSFDIGTVDACQPALKMSAPGRLEVSSARLRRHVKLPPNIPAANFWSVILYETGNGGASSWEWQCMIKRRVLVR